METQTSGTTVVEAGSTRLSPTVELHYIRAGYEHQYVDMKEYYVSSRGHEDVSPFTMPD